MLLLTGALVRAARAPVLYDEDLAPEYVLLELLDRAGDRCQHMA